jgi:hypothetical protein
MIWNIRIIFWGRRENINRMICTGFNDRLLEGG